MGLVRRVATYLTSNKLLLLCAGVAGVGMGLVLAGTTPLVIVSALTMAFSFWLMQKTVGLFNLRFLTIPAFCYLDFVTAVVIPSFFVYADHPGPTRLTFLLAVESSLLSIPFGILLTSLAFRYRRSETLAFYLSPLQEYPPVPSLAIYSLFLILALAITCVYVLDVPTIPLFYMLTHPREYDVLYRLRQESMHLLDSPLHYVYAVLRSALYPLLILLGLGRYLQTRARVWGAAFLASLIAGILFAGFTIAKAPIAAIVVMMCLYLFLHRRGKVGIRFIAVGLIVALAFPVFVILRAERTAQQNTVGSALQFVGYRLFYMPAEVLYYWFEVFPRVVPYQHGMTIGKVANLMGEKPFDADNAVGRYMMPWHESTISANAPFLGNLNADFGMVGVLIGGLLAGVVFQTAQIYLVRRGRSLLTLAMYAFFLYSFQHISALPLNVVVLSEGPAFVLVLAWTMTALSTFRR